MLLYRWRMARQAFHSQIGVKCLIMVTTENDLFQTASRMPSEPTKATSQNQVVYAGVLMIHSQYHVGESFVTAAYDGSHGGVAILACHSQLA